MVFSQRLLIEQHVVRHQSTRKQKYQRKFNLSKTDVKDSHKHEKKLLVHFKHSLSRKLAIRRHIMRKQKMPKENVLKQISSD